MDSWPQDHRHGHKRTYNEMAQQATLSPSPFFFGAGSPSPLLDNTPIFVERRRTSHPHNNQQYRQPSLSNFFSPAREVMAERQQPSHPPSLTHQTSRTVIDLTEDAEDADADLVNARLQQRFPRRPPPQLGRSDGSTFIDLTDDLGEDDLEFIGERELPRQNSPPAPRHRHRARMSHNTLRENIRAIERNEAATFGFIARHNPNDDADQHHHPLAFMEPRRPVGLRFGGDEGMARIMIDAVSRHRAEHQNMPGILDYGLNAFHVRLPVPPAKPKHEPPAEAKQGFTRSPREDDMVICPGCEEELVAKKVEEDDKPQSKKSSRPPSKKDREEHPFWVVKECGHVYCNKCFQHRKYDKKSQLAPIFPEITKENSKSKTKCSLCAVDGCESEITNKDRWVGVFI